MNHHQEEERCKFATFPLKNEHSPPIGCSKLRKITRIQKKQKTRSGATLGDHRRLKYRCDQKIVSWREWSRKPASPKIPFCFSSSSCCAMHSLSRKTTSGLANMIRIRCQKQRTRGTTAKTLSWIQSPSGRIFVARKMPTAMLTTSEQKNAAREL